MSPSSRNFLIPGGRRRGKERADGRPRRNSSESLLLSPPPFTLPLIFDARFGAAEDNRPPSPGASPPPSGEEVPRPAGAAA